MKIVIIGQGYVGSALAIATAKAGHDVIGFDTNAILIGDLKEKESNLKSYHPTNNEADLKDQDAYIIAVPTPLDESNQPDLSYLIQASKLIAKSATKGALVINESTSFPGTLREIVITEIEKVNNSQFLYASAPERIDPANSKWNIKNTPRILAGVDTKSTTAALEFYKSICDDVTAVSSPEVAESAKLFENTFRQVNIALVNELAQISSKLGISANEVIAAAATKPFGFMKFTPGLGVGGHCIPIDPIYLAQQAEAVGAPTSIIRLSDQINTQMADYVVSIGKQLLDNNLKGKNICIVGLSYKRNISDLRNSPSLLLWDLLVEAGANLSYIDDFHPAFRGKQSVNLKGNNFDLSIVATHHDGLDIEALKVSSKLILDCTGSIAGVHSI